MQICVAGWHGFLEFYLVLREVDKKFPVFVISHRMDHPVINQSGLWTEYIDNVGLEWGCYDWFLKNIWDGRSDVLFTHDDTRVKRLRVFEEISWLDWDQCYIFRDRAEEKENGGKHGRAIFMSRKFLSFVRGYECECSEAKDRVDRHHNEGTILLGTGPHRGFWYDPWNRGHVSGKPPIGVRHYNTAIYHFHAMCGRIRDGRLGNPKMKVVGREYFPDYDCARRGKFKR